MKVNHYIKQTKPFTFIKAQVLKCEQYKSLTLSYWSHLQGDSGGICNTLGNDGMCDSKEKSSYEHVSDFGRLQSYGHFLIPVHALV